MKRKREEENDENKVVGRFVVEDTQISAPQSSTLYRAATVALPQDFSERHSIPAGDYSAYGYGYPQQQQQTQLHSNAYPGTSNMLYSTPFQNSGNTSQHQQQHQASATTPSSDAWTQQYAQHYQQQQISQLAQLAKKGKPVFRKAAGKAWDDPTLAEWDPSDFRIFCGDLGNEVSEQMLRDTFASKYSSVQKVRVIRDKKTGKSRGYGFVSFSDPRQYVAALREMNGKYVGNRPMKLRKSRWQDFNDNEKLEAIQTKNTRNKKKKKKKKKKKTSSSSSSSLSSNNKK